MKGAPVRQNGKGGKRKRPVLGSAGWLRPTRELRVEQTMEAMRRLGWTDFLLYLPLSEYIRPEGRAWYDGLVPHLAAKLSLAVCLVPAGSAMSDEEVDQAVGGFAAVHQQVVHCLGIWCGGCRSDAQLLAARQQGWPSMLLQRHQAGKGILLAGSIRELGLGGPCQGDLLPRDLLPQQPMGVFLPAAAQAGQPERQRFPPPAGAREIWLLGPWAGTGEHDEAAQVDLFLRACQAGGDRLFWLLWPEKPSNNGQEPTGPPARGPALLRPDGSSTLLARLLLRKNLEYLAGLRPQARPGSYRSRYILITGGAGFIGVNLADRLAARGERVLVLDSLARPGVEENLTWLGRVHGTGLEAEIADLRDRRSVERAVAQACQVFHCAAQVAVTTSVAEPLEDFAINARGTLQLLEAIRCRPTPPALVFTSTNKVYGKLDGLRFQEAGKRYTPADPVMAANGISERQPLDFYSPYGCSKGTADQYVLDYARIYRLPAVVFRMSCIYGPHQFGTEDQGWVAHFLLRTLRDEPITLYGDGRQVRDVLFVDDLVEALLLAQERMADLQGQAFNIGGGPANAVSLLEMLEMIRRLHGGLPEIGYGPWRPGDQLYYVSDNAKFRQATGWQPVVHKQQGLALLYDWLRNQAPRPAVIQHPEYAQV